MYFAIEKKKKKKRRKKRARLHWLVFPFCWKTNRILMKPYKQYHVSLKEYKYLCFCNSELSKS